VIGEVGDVLCIAEAGGDAVVGVEEAGLAGDLPGDGEVGENFQ
jgi:hypothetical protein